MAITYIDIVPELEPSRRTRSETAPVDSRVANDALPKIPNYGNAAKRGRPVSGTALTPAEKQRRYRERKRAAAS